MSVTAQAVKELRERTGAGMMECKKALVEVDGDLGAAVELLRKSGLAKADKKAGRIAAEGVVVIETTADGKSAAIVEVNSETDFVAREPYFQGFAAAVAKAALESEPANLEELSATVLPSGKTIEETRRELVARIGENIGVRRFEVARTQARLVPYVHGTRIGALVALEGGDDSLGRDLAMHIAAINPQYVSVDRVPADFLAKEREIEIAKAEAEAQGRKPKDIIEKMVDGRLRKSLAEITFLGQPFVRDPDITVEKLLEQKNARVLDFLRYEVGAGIEKKQENFAEEVMAQVRGA
jgi:elongation factor Ts